jgi:hypothetical protein
MGRDLDPSKHIAGETRQLRKEKLEESAPRQQSILLLQLLGCCTIAGEHVMLDITFADTPFEEGVGLLGRGESGPPPRSFSA